MAHFETLTDFIRQTDAQFRILDMGRCISKLSPDNFRKVEMGQVPYPKPFLHQAWIAVLMWNPKQANENVVWFLKLPLDEQGYLVQAARDDFLHRLLQNLSNSMGKGPLNQPTDATEYRDALKDNPFSFTPDQEKMAAFHATATLITRQPASSFYTAAKQYFQGKANLQDWDKLGYQGIADYVIRHQEDNNEAKLAEIFPQLPDAPLEAACTFLEHIQPGEALSNAIRQRLALSVSEATVSANQIGALVRAISQTPEDEQKVAVLSQVLASHYGREAEVIAALASRCWASLQYPQLLKLFLETLADNNAGQACFNRVMADLMFIPTLRALSLQQFRALDRSEALSRAIGAMFGDGFI
ncbi:DUF3549 family protein [Amphritea sp. 1_MG-2023]|uniref:DUF3549 family protein n=1 Tax=Amphritea sp. 1_MG-2023 TaxID=3062670 RepID=UPI0026E41BC7|nr:DUF3549 family protein [Amphritea sp. 1_MG-2023]MDO6564111.1 DUF3549 family protein [Amphritea sp. 1_MG-2023]